MPRRPPSEDHSFRDPRIDAYRGRGAVLTRDGSLVATMYLRGEVWWQRTGGHLWWRRWSSPDEAVHGFMVLADGSFTDWVNPVDDLTDELEDWAAGMFTWLGEQLQVTWQDDQESAKTRDQVFGLDRE